MTHCTFIRVAPQKDKPLSPPRPGFTTSELHRLSHRPASSMFRLASSGNNVVTFRSGSDVCAAGVSFWSSLGMLTSSSSHCTQSGQITFECRSALVCFLLLHRFNPFTDSQPRANFSRPAGLKHHQAPCHQSLSQPSHSCHTPPSGPS